MLSTYIELKKELIYLFLLLLPIICLLVLPIIFLLNKFNPHICRRLELATAGPILYQKKMAFCFACSFPSSLFATARRSLQCDALESRFSFVLIPINCAFNLYYGYLKRRRCRFNKFVPKSGAWLLKALDRVLPSYLEYD